MAFGAGIVLGLFYFGGLWWTTQRIATTRHPIMLILISYVARMATAAVGLYFIMGGQPQRLMAGLVGLLLARLILKRAIAPGREKI